MKLSGEPKLAVRVLSPTKTLVDGLAYAVSATNEAGRFDVLADHANFFSLLSEGDISIMVTLDPKDTLHIPVNKGLMKVTNNQVTLFVDIEFTHTEQ
jgi:F0F1-type ATP synthase epsilon subunit